MTFIENWMISFCLNTYSKDYFSFQFFVEVCKRCLANQFNQEQLLCELTFRAYYLSTAFMMNYSIRIKQEIHVVGGAVGIGFCKDQARIFSWVAVCALWLNTVSSIAFDWAFCCLMQ